MSQDVSQVAFFLDVNRCTGCRSCEVACKIENGVEVGPRWRKVRTVEGDEGGPFMYHVSMACNHCEVPVCADACPSGAITKRPDGIVVVDESKCIGARLCAWACPYDAPQFSDETGIMQKCDFCNHRIDSGVGGPACAEACPTKALQWGTLEEVAAKEGVTDEFGPLPDAEITRQIRADGVHVLVDLMAHTKGCRLGIAAQHPAPITRLDHTILVVSVILPVR